jgi:hypothetical protein
LGPALVGEYLPALSHGDVYFSSLTNRFFIDGK